MRTDAKSPARPIGDRGKNWDVAEKVYSLESAEDVNTGSNPAGERPK